MTNEEALKVLEEAKYFIQDRKHWTRGNYGLLPSRKIAFMNELPQATRVCAIGCLYKFFLSDKEEVRAEGLLNSLSEILYDESLHILNDNHRKDTSHKRVVDVYRTAVEIVRLRPPNYQFTGAKGLLKLHEIHGADRKVV